jgi:hypothetical protein
VRELVQNGSQPAIITTQCVPRADSGATVAGAGDSKAQVLVIGVLTGCSCTQKY